MKSWIDIEAHADEDGFIPESIYNTHVHRFDTCPAIDSDVIQMEAGIWHKYLSARKRGRENKNLYGELYRYEWYEGRNRTGFWGNIEHSVRTMGLGQKPSITIFSAGSGRDLIKVGLAAGIWESVAPENIKGTYKEIDLNFLKLVKPEAKIMVTEYDDSNFKALNSTIDRMVEQGHLSKEMVAIRRWDFRKPSPLATGTQDLAILSLTGNYAKFNEQSIILSEIAKCIKPDGHIVVSTLTPEFKFNMSMIDRVRLFFSSPLTWPVALNFYIWQIRWGKMAASMYKKGFWNNAWARTWADFLKPQGMQIKNIYAAPSTIAPVEVLVMGKKSCP